MSSESMTSESTVRAPKREVYVYCAENQVEDEYDGGRVLFAPVRGQPNDDIADGRLALSFKHDEPMRDYPVTREEKRKRFFRITVEEVDEADLPPDPNAPKPPSAFDMLARAREAALREGKTELAAELAQRLAEGVAIPPERVSTDKS
jgi:hypothetical protein